MASATLGSAAEDSLAAPGAAGLTASSGREVRGRLATEAAGPFERLVAEVATAFSRVAGGDLEGEVGRALEGIASLLEIDQIWLLEWMPAGQDLAVGRSWSRSGASSGTEAREVRGPAPRLYEQLRRGQAVKLVDGEDLLVESMAQGGVARPARTCSRWVVPVSAHGRWVCALAAAGLPQGTAWSDAKLERLRAVGGIVADGLRRRYVEGQLRRSRADVRRLKGRLEAESTYLREEIDLEAGFETLVGRSPALRSVIEQAAQVAPTSVSVLLLGETGTGKELLARAIHARSPRHARALVKVNCAALPPSLVESELFGHEKGAFTGATSARPGRFELAEGGTLLLDEVGEIPPDVQVKLLRVLQDGEFERVGGTRTRKADVRLIAATNRDLERAIAEGRFREDLYYRLSAFPLRLPPLRERREDIPLLVWNCIQQRQDELGRRIERIPEAAMEALVEYAWPGNARELGNVIERALILSHGAVLELDLALGSTARAPGPPRQRLADVERAHIVRILERCAWKINGRGNAAEILGLHPNTLRSRLKKLGVRRPARGLESRAVQGSEPSQVAGRGQEWHRTTHEIS